MSIVEGKKGIKPLKMIIEMIIIATNTGWYDQLPIEELLHLQVGAITLIS